LVNALLTSAQAANLYQQVAMDL